MAATDVEITISSASDLKNVNWKHGDLCAYAVAWIEDGKPPVKVTTRVDGSGDSNPSWGQKFTLSVSRDRLEDARLIIEIFHDKAEDREKAIVGRASLALLDVMDEGGYHGMQDYMLNLKRPSGRPHGKLTITVRLREKRGGYAAPPTSSPYGQSAYYKDGGQANRDWQPAYPGYNSPNYPSQPYAQNYPSQPYAYSGNAPYGGQSQSYGSYGGGNPSYGAPPQQSYGAPSSNYYDQPQNPANPQKKSGKFGGMGTGLAVGALAGVVGGLALDEFVDHKEEEAADKQAAEDADRYDGGNDDYGYGDDY